jgi:hypothetical protein
MERVRERERGRDGEREVWGQREEDKSWVVVAEVGMGQLRERPILGGERLIE